jgi:predicted nucleic acid-binding protein
MLILDTNVIAEFMKPTVNDSVKEWLNDQAIETLYLTSVTVAELSYGVEALEDGRRRNRLRQLLNSVTELFDGRILPFSHVSAQHYGRMSADARRRGRTLSIPDAYIAAIALASSYAVVTRDSTPFRNAGVVVIDPWNGSTELNRL